MYEAFVTFIVSNQNANKVALEIECDLILAIMFKHSLKGDVPTIQKTLKPEGVAIEDDDLGSVLAILNTEGFLERFIFYEEPPLRKPIAAMSITLKGIAFLSIDTFVERKKRWELEKKIKEQQATLNNIELALKPYTFVIALLGFGIAIGSLILGIFNATHKP